MKPATENFFHEQTDASRIKTEIVHEYFWIWSNIIGNHLAKRDIDYKIGYVDLFSGPGRYRTDNTKSTPIVILETAIQHPTFSRRLATIFNDLEVENCEDLKMEIAKLQDIDVLRFDPVVENFEINDAIVGWLQARVDFPSLYFLDPCGYKGLSLRLVEYTLNGWGNDCIFFFNYNRINQHLENPVMEQNMNDFFGVSRAVKMRAELIGKGKEDRQDVIIRNLREALADLGGKYTMEYCFTKNDGNRTSHFLIFTSKHPAGFNKMKEVMARRSASFNQGVPSYKLTPKPSLFDVEMGISDLAMDLLDSYSATAKSFKQVYYEHGATSKFTLINYQDAIRELEISNRVSVSPPANERPKRNNRPTVGLNILIRFP
jgi:three-Cys-motif partner protein